MISPISPGRRKDWAPPWNLQRQSCSWHCHRTWYGDVSKPWYPCSSHQNSWDKNGCEYPTKNAMYRYWSIPIWRRFCLKILMAKPWPSLTISWSNMFPNLQRGSGKRLKNHSSLSLHPPSCGPLFGYVCHVFKTFRFKSPAQRSTVG